MFSQNYKFAKIRAVAPLIAVGCLDSHRKRSNNTNVRRKWAVGPGPSTRCGRCRWASRGLDNKAGLLTAFQVGLKNFQEVENVAEDGLGPRFNSNSCVSCHIQPAIGGTSPDVNPQVAFQNGQNKLPSFIKRERSGSRGPLHQEEGRYARWRRTRPLHDRRSSRRAVELPYGAGGLLQFVEHQPPDSYPDIRLGVG